MKHAKFLLAAAIAVVLGLVGAACSSDSSDSSPAMTAATTAAGAGTTAATQPETATTVAEAAEAAAEAQGLPPALGTETTTTTSTTTVTEPTTASSLTETSETPSTTTTTTSTSAAPATTSSTTTTTTVVEDLSPAELAVRVLNGSGVAGAAGRLSASLEDAGYIVLPAGNAPGRVGSSVVYFVASAHRDEAEGVAEAVAESVGMVGDGGVAVASLPSSGEIQPGSANVVVVIGTDDIGSGLRAVQASSGLRPSPRSDVALPLPASTPRDSYVPGLADIQIFSQINDNSDSGEVLGAMNALSG